MRQAFGAVPGDEKLKPARICAPDGNEYSVRDDQRAAGFTTRITLAGLHQIQLPGELIEVIRDPHDANCAIFLRCAAGVSSLHPKLARDGKFFLPPALPLNSSLAPSLPSGLRECGTPGELALELLALLPNFLDLTRDQSLLVATFGLATWFPECFEFVPYLWPTGPLGSGKTKLLRFLKGICRRAVMVGDVRGAAIYQLVDAWAPTLIIDEFEQATSGTNSELLRLLRSGNQPDTPAVRNGVTFATFGFKAMSSRQPPVDGALASRCLTFSMRPTDRETMPLDKEAMESVAQEFQDKFLSIRVKYRDQVRNFKISSDRLVGLTPRMKQVARALATPLLGAEPLTSQLLQILAEDDAQGRVDRSLEPEWLTVEALMRLCHEKPRGGCLFEIVVGTVAAEINHFLKFRGEDTVLKARKIGQVLKSLGLRTEKLGNLGRGIRLNSSTRREIHELARRFEIDRLALCSPDAPKWGYGGAPCTLCDEFGLGAGLRYVPVTRWRPRTLGRTRPPLLAKRD